MNSPLRSMISHVCTALAVLVMSLFAVGSMYLLLDEAFSPLKTKRLAEVARSTKSDRLPFADVSMNVARRGKARDRPAGPVAGAAGGAGLSRPGRAAPRR